MAVALRNAAAVVTGTTSITITGCTATINDLMIMWVFHKAFATLPTTPSGWKLNGDLTVASNNGTLAVYYKYATTTGAQSNVTIAGLTSCSVGAMGSFSGVDLRAPFLRDDTVGVTYKFQSNVEGTYGVPAAGATFPGAPAGCAALAFIGYDNDASTVWSSAVTFLYNDGGGTAKAMTELGDALTTTGTDCGGSWAYTIQQGAYQGFTPVPTEGGAGTADSIALLCGLRADVGALAASSTLVDDFDDNTPDTAKWTLTGSPTPTETGGQLTFPGASNKAYVSKAYYDPDSVMVKVTGIPTNNGIRMSVGNCEGSAPESCNAHVGFTVWSPTLGLAYVYGPNFTQLATFTYAATERAAEPYLKIEIDATNVTWSTGDGATSWTQRYQTPRTSLPGVDFDLARVYLWGADVTTGGFDNFNTLGATASPSVISVIVPVQAVFRASTR